MICLKSLQKHFEARRKCEQALFSKYSSLQWVQLECMQVVSLYFMYKIMQLTNNIGDVELINYLQDAAGARNLVIDLSVTHESFWEQLAAHLTTIGAPAQQHPTLSVLALNAVETPANIPDRSDHCATRSA